MHKLCLLISVLIAIQQYYNLFNLNGRYVPIIAPTQYEALIDSYPSPRVIGMTSNPNVYALMPGMGVIITWSMYLARREKKNILLMIIFLLAVLMTKSRSGFVFTACGVLVFMVVFFYDSLKKSRFNKKVVGMILLSTVMLILSGLAIFKYLPKELTWRLIAGINIHADNSFQTRLINWQEHILYIKSSPLFGIGPAKSVKFKHHVDNEWLLFLRHRTTMKNLRKML